MSCEAPPILGSPQAGDCDPPIQSWGSPGLWEGLETPPPFNLEVSLSSWMEAETPRSVLGSPQAAAGVEMPH